VEAIARHSHTPPGGRGRGLRNWRRQCAIRLPGSAAVEAARSPVHPIFVSSSLRLFVSSSLRLFVASADTWAWRFATATGLRETGAVGSCEENLTTGRKRQARANLSLRNRGSH